MHLPEPVLLAIAPLPSVWTSVLAFVTVPVSAGALTTALVGTVLIAWSAHREWRLRNSERQHARVAARYQALFESNPQPMWVYDLTSLRFVMVNEATVRHYGYSREQFEAMTIRDLQVSGTAQDPAAGSSSLPRGVTPFVRHRRRDGIIIDVELTTHAVQFDGRSAGLVLARDITERRRVETLESDRRRIVEMVARNQPLLETLQQISSLVENQNRTMRCGILLAGGHAKPRVITSSLPSVVLEGFDDTVFEAVLAARQGVAGRSGTGERPHAATWDLTRCHFWKRHEPQAEEHGLAGWWFSPISAKNGQTLGAVLVARSERRSLEPADAGLVELAAGLAGIAIEQKQLSEQLAYQANHDVLTGLPNRLLFAERLREALAQSRETQRPFGVLYIDLDRFKLVNDILGHKVGDALLQQVARRLESCLRAGDTLARMGGDEFTVVLTSLQTVPEGAETAEALVRVLSTPFDVHGHELFVTASIGVSFYPSDGSDAETLQRRADSAMYRAKNQGKNAYQCFTPEMETAPQRLALESQLRRALSQNELVLYYQPQMLTLDRTLAGFEALIRWQHPELGMISPAQFIPIAEESGLIVSIGTWAIQEVCRQNRAWQDAGNPKVKIAVNVSAMQFGRVDFIDTVANALAESGLDPSYLELELTESMVMRDVETSRRQMDKLRALGVSVAIDDFGTGYSSLSYLHHLPVDTLKIDQSFIQQMRDKAEQPQLVQAVIALGHGLGMRVTAEGVETERQFEVLRELGCDKAQGYLLGRPVPSQVVFPPRNKSVATPGSLLALQAMTDEERKPAPVPPGRGTLRASAAAGWAGPRNSAEEVSQP